MKKIITSIICFVGIFLLVFISLQNCDTSTSTSTNANDGNKEIVEINGTYEFRKSTTSGLDESIEQYKLSSSSGNKVTGTVAFKASALTEFRDTGNITGELKKESDGYRLDITIEFFLSRTTKNVKLKVLGNGAKLEDEDGNTYIKRKT